MSRMDLKYFQFWLGDPTKFAVEVHLPTAEPQEEWQELERIQSAIVGLLDNYDYHPLDPPCGDVICASWHWQEWFTRVKPDLQREGQEIYADLKEAVRRQQIDAAGAESFGTRAAAAAELLRSLEPYPSAIVRLGDVILAKATINGVPRVVVETVSPSMAREMELNPIISRDPVAFFGMLDSLPQKRLPENLDDVSPGIG